ncbi:MAG: tyrosine-type recombinase/integrase [Proteobacteria bacterium]|nr:tyrosine-type recombinase/integrase [Pseudomonadota bacterium]
MARGINQLSARTVANLTDEGAHADGGGLYYVITKTGSRSWQFWHVVAGKRSKQGLGGYPDVSLADARAKAAALRGRLAAGEDIRPSATKSSAPTFGDIAEEVLARKVFKSPIHRRQWERALRELAGDLTPLPVNTVTRRHVMDVLSPHWQRVPETAQKLRGCIEKVLARATALDHRTGNNPAAWKDGLKELLEPQDSAKRGHFASMRYHDVPAFMTKLVGRSGGAALALAVTILTASRQGEVSGMDWREVDLDRALWTVPKERMKAKREHLVPLSAQAVAMLRALAHRDGLVFPSRDGSRLSQMSISMAARRAVAPKGVRPENYASGFTVHGFRSSFRVWCSETGKNRELAELCLAHQIGNAVEQAYNRTTVIEQRRVIMQEWADYVLRDVPTAARIT